MKSDNSGNNSNGYAVYIFSKSINKISGVSSGHATFFADRPWRVALRWMSVVSCIIVLSNERLTYE
jgi:hypothetical protein